MLSFTKNPSWFSFTCMKRKKKLSFPRSPPERWDWKNARAEKSGLCTSQNKSLRQGLRHLLVNCKNYLLILGTNLTMTEIQVSMLLEHILTLWHYLIIWVDKAVTLWLGNIIYTGCCLSSQMRLIVKEACLNMQSVTSASPVSRPEAVLWDLAHDKSQRVGHQSAYLTAYCGACKMAGRIMWAYKSQERKPMS